jgi:hypothetical protein
MPHLGKAIMEQIKRTLDPLIDSMPEGLRDYWMVIFCAVALAILLPVAWYQRRILRVLVGPRAPRQLLPEPSEEDLSTTPMPSGSPSSRRLVVEGLPARARLVVMAPLGKAASVDAAAMEELLNNVIWGMGTIVAQDSPKVVIWPPQLSAHGFAAVFHRLTRKPEADGLASRWVLVGGPTPPRPRPILLGLGLWTDEPTTIGRLSMQPIQWANSLHIQTFDFRPDSTVSATPENNKEQVLDNQRPEPARETVPAQIDGSASTEPRPVSESGH